MHLANRLFTKKKAKKICDPYRMVKMNSSIKKCEQTARPSHQYKLHKEQQLRKLMGRNAFHEENLWTKIKGALKQLWWLSIRWTPKIYLEIELPHFTTLITGQRKVRETIMLDVCIKTHEQRLKEQPAIKSYTENTSIEWLVAMQWASHTSRQEILTSNPSVSLDKNDNSSLPGALPCLTYWQFVSLSYFKLQDLGFWSLLLPVRRTSDVRDILSSLHSRIKRDKKTNGCMSSVHLLGTSALCMILESYVIG